MQNQNSFSKRAALEQFVGNEAFVQFENELAARESGEPSKVKQNEVQDNSVNEAYAETIKNVENYTNNLVTSSSEQNNSESYSCEENNVMQKSEKSDLPSITTILYTMLNRINLKLQPKKILLLKMRIL